MDATFRATLLALGFWKLHNLSSCNMHPHILITDAGLEERSSPDFYRPYSNQDGQIFSPTLLLPHPDFQTFLRPYEGGGGPEIW